jgi:hypothetical protein
MTRKDYILIAAHLLAAKADALRTEDSRAATDMCDGIDLGAEHLADALARDNPRFDRAWFLTACGVES